MSQCCNPKLLLSYDCIYYRLIQKSINILTSSTFKVRGRGCESDVEALRGLVAECESEYRGSESVCTVHERIDISRVILFVEVVRVLR
jgi:hypothetical protein